MPQHLELELRVNSDTRRVGPGPDDATEVTQGAALGEGAPVRVHEWALPTRSRLLTTIAGSPSQHRLLHAPGPHVDQT